MYAKVAIFLLALGLGASVALAHSEPRPMRPFGEPYPQVPTAPEAVPLHFDSAEGAVGQEALGHVDPNRPVAFVLRSPKRNRTAPYGILLHLPKDEAVSPDWVAAASYADQPLNLTMRKRTKKAETGCGTGAAIAAELARLSKTVLFQDIVFAPAALRAQRTTGGLYREWYGRLEPASEMRIYFTNGGGEIDLFDGALVRQRYSD